MVVTRDDLKLRTIRSGVSSSIPSPWPSSSTRAFRLPFSKRLFSSSFFIISFCRPTFIRWLLLPRCPLHAISLSLTTIVQTVQRSWPEELYTANGCVIRLPRSLLIRQYCTCAYPCIEIVDKKADLFLPEFWL